MINYFNLQCKSADMSNETDTGFDFGCELNKALENCIENTDVDDFDNIINSYNIDWNSIIWFTDLDYEVELMDVCLDNELYSFFRLLYTKNTDENNIEKYIEYFKTNDFGCVGYERGKTFVKYSAQLREEIKTSLIEILPFPIAGFHDALHTSIMNYTLQLCDAKCDAK